VAGYEKSCTRRACPSISYPPRSANATALPASLRESLERIDRNGKSEPLLDRINRVFRIGGLRNKRKNLLDHVDPVNPVDMLSFVVWSFRTFVIGLSLGFDI
jgi:hypothetical protein